MTLDVLFILAVLAVFVFDVAFLLYRWWPTRNRKDGWTR